MMILPQSVNYRKIQCDARRSRVRRGTRESVEETNLLADQYIRWASPPIRQLDIVEQARLLQMRP